MNLWSKWFCITALFICSWTNFLGKSASIIDSGMGCERCILNLNMSTPIFPFFFSSKRHRESKIYEIPLSYHLLDFSSRMQYARLWLVDISKHDGTPIFYWINPWQITSTGASPFPISSNWCEKISADRLFCSWTRLFVVNFKVFLRVFYKVEYFRQAYISSDGVDREITQVICV